MPVFARQRRELRRLDARLVLDSVRARDARRQVGISARRDLARPAMLIAPLTAGVLVGVALSRSNRVGSREANEDPVRTTGLVALAATWLRLWSRSSMVRNLLKPVIRSIVEPPPQTVVAPPATRNDTRPLPDAGAARSPRYPA